MVIDLEVAGLLKRAGRGVVVRGPVELDAIANSHQLGDYRTARLQRHQAERSAWKQWLDQREQARIGGSHIETQETAAAAALSAGLDEDTERAYLDLTMSTGPPPMDNIDIEREAIDIVADLLGGRILVA
ncbi:hypothetical protein BN970_06962 [Mycolicibacterium conceptionense]|nr:hypothetical protein BN970_06962 [Mycolicibacterium conceptionense]